MMNDLLFYEVSEVQKEYKDLLLRLKEKLTQNNYSPILDEIEVFWYKHRRLVRYALQYLSKPYQTYVFTAAVILDIDDLEHYPFLCLGNCHIWDDPICSYFHMKEKAPNEEFNREIEEQILRTIDDNIRIISELNNYIFILPIRMISEVDFDTRTKTSESAFFSLFKQPPPSIGAYLNDYNTIEELDNGISEVIKDRIVFSDNDISSHDFIQRFNKYKSTSHLPIRKNATDAEAFFMIVFGYISQAIDIISNAVTYRFVPYIRYDVAFKYFLILYGAFEDNPENNLWIQKAIVAHMIHMSFEKDLFTKTSITDYVKRIKKTNFEKELFKEIEKEQVFTHKESLPILIEIINKTIRETLLNDD